MNMRLAVTVVSPATRQSTDIVLDADPATPMAAVAAELDRFARGDSGRSGGAQPGAAPAAALYVDCQRVWQRLTLAEAPVRDGCVISLGSPDGCVAPEPAGLVDVLVTGGPDAGAIHRIGPGRADIGGGAAAAIRIGDPGVPARALVVDVDQAGGCHVAAYPGTAATLDRMQLGAPVRWLPGQQIAIGGTLLGLAPYAPPDPGLRPSSDGAGVDFGRPPRAVPAEAGAAASGASSGAASAPGAVRSGAGSAGVGSAGDRRPWPVLAAGLPLVVGLGLAFVLHQIWLLAVAALSPVLLIGGALGERGGGGWRTGENSGDRALREGDARAAIDAEQAARREQCPDPATALGIASGPRGRLWERRRADPDYLLLRLGTADLTVPVELAGQEQGERGGRRRTVLRSVPDALVTVPLAECGVLGVAGPGDSARAVGRWLVASAAILHSPNELRIYLLTDDAGRAGWEWVRWLPHCRPGPGGRCAAQLGNDAESVGARIEELLSIVAARQQVIRDGHRGVGGGPGVVVVLDGSRRLRSLPGVGQLLAEGPRAGVYAICLDDAERLLPAECQAVAGFGRGGLRVQQTSADTVDGVRADHADPGWCARVARSLAPVRDVGDEGHRVHQAGAGQPTPLSAPTSPTSPIPTAATTSTTAASPAEDVWVASVGWSALGRPEPARPARRPRRRDDVLADAGEHGAA
jgi:S-DNA-T family DNA segregation ATPase FtsK/SpoIIIE